MRLETTELPYRPTIDPDSLSGQMNQRPYGCLTNEEIGEFKAEMKRCAESGRQVFGLSPDPTPGVG